jgi:hypothetical protein
MYSRLEAIHGTKIVFYHPWRRDAHHWADVLEDGARLGWVALQGTKRLRVVEAARGGEVALSVVRAVVASRENPCILGRAVKQIFHAHEARHRSSLQSTTQTCVFPLLSLDLSSSTIKTHVTVTETSMNLSIYHTT